MMEPFFTSAAFAAFIATGMISLAPNIILFLMPGYAHGSGDTSTWLALGQAIGAGGLLADVFLHTLPESSNEASGIYILVGFTIFFAVDLMVRSVNENHGQHNTTSKTNAKEGRGIHVKTTKRSIVLLNLVADALHNFTDGLAIGASYSMIDKSSAISSSLSSANVWSTLKSHSRGGFATLSICFHEIPHELSKCSCCYEWSLMTNEIS
jgi:solute carrier family 39 (zinc transporter), member 7